MRHPYSKHVGDLVNWTSKAPVERGKRQGRVKMHSAEALKMKLEEPAAEMFSHALASRRRMIRGAKTSPSQDQTAFDAVSATHQASATSSRSYALA